MTTTNDTPVRLDSLSKGARFQFAGEDRVYVVVETAPPGEGGAVHVQPETLGRFERLGNVSYIKRGEMVRPVEAK